MSPDLPFYVSNINFTTGNELFLLAGSFDTTRYCGNLGDAHVICKNKAVIFFCQPLYIIGMAANKYNCCAQKSCKNNLSRCDHLSLKILIRLLGK